MEESQLNTDEQNGQEINELQAQSAIELQRMREGGSVEIDAQIPEHAAHDLGRWIWDGVVYSDFLRALLSNDLTYTVARADSHNRRILANYVIWLANRAPRGCYGSTKRRDAWEKQGGLNGRLRAASAAVKRGREDE